MSDYLKNLFKNHEEQPAPEMWEKVMSDVKHHNAVVRARKIGVAASVLVAGGIAAFLLLNNNAVSDNETEIAQATTAQSVAVQAQSDNDAISAVSATSEEKTAESSERQTVKSNTAEVKAQHQNTVVNATPAVVSQQSSVNENEIVKANTVETSVQPALVTTRTTNVSEQAPSTVAATTATTTTAQTQPVQPANNNKVKAGTNPDPLPTPNTEEIKFVMPTAIAPDQGDNNMFCVVCNHPELLKNFEMNIFTRNGLQVYHTKTMTECWDGKYKGRIQPMGAYAYVIIYTTPSGEKKVEKGTVTIVR